MGRGIKGEVSTWRRALLPLLGERAGVRAGIHPINFGTHLLPFAQPSPHPMGRGIKREMFNPKFSPRKTRNTPKPGQPGGRPFGQNTRFPPQAIEIPFRVPWRVWRTFLHLRRALPPLLGERVGVRADVLPLRRKSLHLRFTFLQPRFHSLRGNIDSPQPHPRRLQLRFRPLHRQPIPLRGKPCHLQSHFRPLHGRMCLLPFRIHSLHGRM